MFHNATYNNFKLGNVRNPYDRTTFDVGYTGVGKYQTRINGVNTDYYNKWHDLIRRCYYEDAKEIFPAYYGSCEVCNQWHNLQLFAEWYEENYYEVDERLHLDKDILYPGNKIYSPDTCVLVPQRINMLFMNKENKRGLPNGIIQKKNGYSVSYSTEKLGVYETLEEAYEVDSKVKKEAIINIANEYKGIIPQKLYDALLRYEVRMEIDKNYAA